MKMANNLSEQMKGLSLENDKIVVNTYKVRKFFS